jgi:hypothetical protein
MKNDPMTTFLNFVLAVLVVLGVVFALLTMSRERELRLLTTNATIAQTTLARANALLNDTANYNAKAQSPELTRIIQAAQKPATH